MDEEYYYYIMRKSTGLKTIPPQPKSDVEEPAIDMDDDPGYDC